jgi:hypothetical protein
MWSQLEEEGAELKLPMYGGSFASSPEVAARS